MIITRKIKIIVCEDDAALRRQYYQKLYANRNAAVKVANMAVSHLFALDNTLPYLSEECRDTVKFIGVKGNAATRQNAPYVVASKAFKGQVDMGMVSCVLQNVQKMYQDDRKRGMWERSLRSYKSNMPIPYKPDRFLNFRSQKYVNNEGKEVSGVFFTLTGVPFQMAFGRDKSGNRLIVRRLLSQALFDSTGGREGEATGYRFCTSSIAFEKKFDPKTEKQQSVIYLYLCVDIPQQKNPLDPNKTVYSYLGFHHPIMCLLDDIPYPDSEDDRRWFHIGDSHDFLHRRVQIQEALRRLQKGCKYNRGGRGRKHKMQAIETFKKKEKNYITEMLHNYTRELVNLAVSHGCGTICLVNQKAREVAAKLDDQNDKHFMLRNWSYYSLKNLLSYKCKLAGIKVKEVGKAEEESAEDYEDGAVSE